MGPIDKIYEEISVLREQYDSWYKWHCNDPVCYHHMCVVRRKKMRKLTVELNKLTYAYALTLRRGRNLNYIDSAITRALSYPIR